MPDFLKIFLTVLALVGSVPNSLASSPERLKVRAVREYPHDTGAYTQGLFFDGGQLYESTGQYGLSSFRKVDLTSGKTLQSLKFGRKYFVEGSTMMSGKLFVLTWTNKVAFVYNASTLEYEKTYSYPREGWGLTNDGNNLIASDGSSKLYFMDAEFKLQRTVEVRLNGRNVRYLNELEWIDGKIWANVYMTDVIFIINPQNGIVETVVNCEGLLPESKRKPSTDVLNGIASCDGKIYLTGKNWPSVFEVSLVRQ